MVRTFGIESDPRKRIRTRQGDAIRSTRELRGYSTEEFAEMLDVTPGAVRHWEVGRYSPRPHHQVAIAKALQVPWGVLFNLDAEVA